MPGDRDACRQPQGGVPMVLGPARTRPSSTRLTRSPARGWRPPQHPRFPWKGVCCAHPPSFGPLPAPQSVAILWLMPCGFPSPEQQPLEERGGQLAVCLGHLDCQPTRPCGKDERGRKGPALPAPRMPGHHVVPLFSPVLGGHQRRAWHRPHWQLPWRQRLAAGEDQRVLQ